jgi:NTE family protein
LKLLYFEACFRKESARTGLSPIFSLILGTVGQIASAGKIFYAAPHKICQDEQMNTFPTHTTASKGICLALQGGGSHGAFTWGVLDALLADGRLRFSGISGASAGAVNAVAVAHGLAAQPEDALAAAESARKSLRKIWEGIASLGSLGAMTQSVMKRLLGDWPHASGLSHPFLQNAMTPWMSPYQLNPLDINPLRQLLEDHIDFDRIQKLECPKVFVSATHVKTGRSELFGGDRMNLQAVMASACLPTLFQAVEIDGEHYWDGGFSGNPALEPLIDLCSDRDILVVQINPLRRQQTPQSQQDILDRINELTFNASLVEQMRGIDLVNRLIEKGRLEEGRGYRQLMLHRIDGGDELEQLPPATKFATDGAMFEQLFDLGSQAGLRWLNDHFDDLGRRSSIDIRQDYAGQTPYRV